MALYPDRPQNALLDRCVHRLKKGIPAIADEFDVSFERVWRGTGLLAAGYVNITSIYHHQPIPAPRHDRHNHEVDQDAVGGYHHGHDQQDQAHHEHEHDHNHNHEHDHQHEHQHSRTHHNHSLDDDHHHSSSTLGSVGCAEDVTKIGRTQKSTATTAVDHEHRSTRQGHDAPLEGDQPNDIPHLDADQRYNYDHRHQQHQHQHDHHHNHHDDSKKSREGDGPLRNFPQIRHLIHSAPDEYLPPWVKTTAVAAFFALATAECHVHGASSIDQVHFHEVGAVDSIADTVLTLLALYELHCQVFTFTPLPLGYGTVQTAHGLLPVPAPATLFLMRHRPVVAGPPGWTGELVTPTAAALINALSEAAVDVDADRCRPPPFTLRAIGVGAGRKDFSNHPNVLRLLIGDITS